MEEGRGWIRFIVSYVVPCRIVRRFACSSLVVLPSRSVVVPSSFRPSSRSPSCFSSVGSFPLPVSSTREGGAFFSFDSERASKHEGVAGRGIAIGRPCDGRGA